jgi:hypothetical protein
MVILLKVRYAILSGGRYGRQRLALRRTICYNIPRMTKSKKVPTATDKPVTDLPTFIQNVNKRDKLNGLKITFGFSKRKRK